MILFTLSLYFFFLIRSLFVCLLVMFTLLVVTLLVENFREKNLVSYCSPSQIFPRKIFLFLFPFSSIQSKHFCEQIPLFCFICFFFEKKLSEKIFRILWKNHPFFITFCFCSSRFAFTSVFHFRFCLIFGFFLISFFLNSFFLLLHFLQFSLNNNNFSFLLFFFKKKLFKYPFYMHGLPLDVLLLKHFSKKKKTCLFISFFWCTFSWVFVFACLSFFFRFFLLLFYSFVFSNIFLFCSRSWMFFSVGPFYWSLFWKLCLVWTSFFSPFKNFSFYILSLLHKKVMFFFWIVPFVLSLFFEETVSCLLVLQRE